MNDIDYSDRDKIRRLFNKGGHMLDFSSDRYGDFVEEISGNDLFRKYGGSKGKNLEMIVKSEPGALVGRLILALIKYGRSRDLFATEELAAVLECEEPGWVAPIHRRQ